VTFSKETKKWQAILYTNRKRYHLGYFTTIKAARVARLAKERELFDKFTPRQYITVETQ
jgi:hypothetical protein